LTARTRWPIPACALAGLTAAVALRVRIAGTAGAQSVPAGAVFGLVLAGLALACGFVRPLVNRRQIAYGTGAAAVLCVPPLVHWAITGGVGEGGGTFWTWAVVVTWVAIAEELLLRGALYDATHRAWGQNAAIGLAAVAFALVHVPVYGWHVVPLDLAVGVALGALRAAAGSVTAPALAHTLADLAGWWLR
jgi:membrane protease YdiL (CAAX protease family)